MVYNHTTQEDTCTYNQYTNMCIHILGTCPYTCEIKLWYIKVTVCKYTHTKCALLYSTMYIILECNSKHSFTVLQEWQKLNSFGIW